MNLEWFKYSEKKSKPMSTSRPCFIFWFLGGPSLLPCPLIRAWIQWGTFLWEPPWVVGEGAHAMLSSAGNCPAVACVLPAVPCGTSPKDPNSNSVNSPISLGHLYTGQKHGSTLWAKGPGWARDRGELHHVPGPREWGPMVLSVLKEEVFPACEGALEHRDSPQSRDPLSSTRHDSKLDTMCSFRTHWLEYLYFNDVI